MDTPDNAATTTATAAVETVIAPVEKKFSQDEVNALIGQRLAEDRSRRAAPVAAAKPVEKSTGDTDLRAELEEMKLRNAFDKRAAKLDIPDSAAERLFRLYKVDRPEDPGAWFAETSKDFVLKGSNVNNNQNPNGTAAPMPAPASAPSAPSRVDSLTASGLPDIWNFSLEQLAARGSAGIREDFEKLVQVGNQRSGAPPLPRAVQKK